MAGATLVLPSGVGAEYPIAEPEVEYAVTYEVGVFETQTIRPVKLLDVVTIGGKAFLAVEVKSFSKKLQGFLELERIRTILPASQEGFSVETHPSPERQPVILSPDQR